MKSDPQQEGRVVVLCAFEAEAAELIQALSLAPGPTLGAIKTFGLGGPILAAVSGPGMLASASAVGLGAGLLGPGTYPCFFNLGICGHSTLPVGQALLANKVVAGDPTLPALYPAIAPRSSLQSDQLTTQTKVETQFAKPGAYDLEGYGFLGAALRYAGAEQCALFKVVSDGPSDHRDSAPFRIQPKKARALIATQIPAILAQLKHLQAVSASLAARHQDPPHLETLRGLAHYSQTQSHRLKTLLLRWSARHEGRPPCPPAQWFAKGAQGGLDTLEQALCTVPEL